MELRVPLRKCRVLRSSRRLPLFLAPNGQPRLHVPYQARSQDRGGRRCRGWLEKLKVSFSVLTSLTPCDIRSEICYLTLSSFLGECQVGRTRKMKNIAKTLAIGIIFAVAGHCLAGCDSGTGDSTSDT